MGKLHRHFFGCNIFFSAVAAALTVIRASSNADGKQRVLEPTKGLARASNALHYESFANAAQQLGLFLSVMQMPEEE